MDVSAFILPSKRCKSFAKKVSRARRNSHVFGTNRKLLIVSLFLSRTPNNAKSLRFLAQAEFGMKQ